MPSASTLQSMQPADFARDANKEARASATKLGHDFETMFLNIMIEQALPESKAAFGQGIAGSMARAKLANELSRAIAMSGGLGLGARVFR